MAEIPLLFSGLDTSLLLIQTEMVGAQTNSDSLDKNSYHIEKWTKSALCFQTFTHKTHIPSWYFKTVHLLLIVQLFAVPSRFAQTWQIYHDKPQKMWRIMLSNYCMGFVGFPNMFRPLSSALVQNRLTLSIWPFWMGRITKNTILYWLSKMTFPEKYQSAANREPTTVPHVRIAGWLRVISQVVELHWNQHIYWSLIFGVGTCGWHRTKIYVIRRPQQSAGGARPRKSFSRILGAFQELF